MTCPKCGQRRFVPFVLSVDGQTLAGENFGRCDREQSCGYFRYPSFASQIVTAPPQPAPVLPPALFHNLPTGNITDNNTLWRAYGRVLGKALKTSLFFYKCGTDSDGACVFPQFDGTYYRTAKSILYDGSGHRVKNFNAKQLPVRWWHKLPENRNYMQCHRLSQCFFGQHLLKEFPEAEVAIVESEKTAVLISAIDSRSPQERIWIACGGSQMLKGAIDLSILKGREVTLFPDDGQYFNWLRTATRHGWGCWNISPAKAEHKLPDGCDIWDYCELLRIKNKE